MAQEARKGTKPVRLRSDCRVAALRQLRGSDICHKRDAAVWDLAADPVFMWPWLTLILLHLSTRLALGHARRVRALMRWIEMECALHEVADGVSFAARVFARVDACGFAKVPMRERPLFIE